MGSLVRGLYHLAYAAYLWARGDPHRRRDAGDLDPIPGTARTAWRPSVGTDPPADPFARERNTCCDLPPGEHLMGCQSAERCHG